MKILTRNIAKGTTDPGVDPLVSVSKKQNNFSTAGAPVILTVTKVSTNPLPKFAQKLIEQYYVYEHDSPFARKLFKQSKQCERWKQCKQ